MNEINKDSGVYNQKYNHAATHCWDVEKDENLSV